MTSEKQRETNRRNALKSTGPRSRAGKEAASRNARRHGLSVPIDIGEVQGTFDALVRLLEEDSIENAHAKQIAYWLIEYERTKTYEQERLAAQIMQDEKARESQQCLYDEWYSAGDEKRVLRLIPKITSRRIPPRRYEKRSFNQLMKAIKAI